MTTRLQQALLDDNVSAVEHVIRLGCYPRAVYKKAFKRKAWRCVQWLATTFSNHLAVEQWRELSKILCIDMDPDVVRRIHVKHIVEASTVRVWRASAADWESRGVHFDQDFYRHAYKPGGIPFHTRVDVKKLGALHRFEAVEAWLNMEPKPTSRDVNDVYTQLVFRAVRRYDALLLSWLDQRWGRYAVMDAIYRAINAKMIKPSVARVDHETSFLPWSMDDFLSKGIGFLSGVEEFCEYVALYDTHRLREMWRHMEPCVAVPNEWRDFLASGASRPAPSSSMQRLVTMLHGLFPTDVAQRMHHLNKTKNASVAACVDLVDLL